MPKKLTLSEIDLVARTMAPEWWEGLTTEERLNVVNRYNQSQAAADSVAQYVEARAKDAVS
jgi:hypothetical protein